MELSFVCDNAADASFLVQELEIALRESGLPAGAVSLRQSSQANMDIGSVLSVGMDVASNILGPIGSVAALAKCVYEVVAKHNSPVVIVHSDGERIEITPAKANFKRIEKALTKSTRPKLRPKSRT